MTNDDKLKTRRMELKWTFGAQPRLLPYTQAWKQYQFFPMKILQESTENTRQGNVKQWQETLSVCTNTKAKLRSN